MIKKFNYHNITWLDLEAPTKDDVDQLVKDYGIHPVPAAELLTPSRRSRVDVYEKFIYLILHFPTCQICYGPRASGGKEIQEIDFIVGKDFIITTHYEMIDFLDEFAKLLETTDADLSGKQSVHAGYLFFHMMRRLYGSLEEGLEFINDSLRHAEKKIFSGAYREMVRTLSALNRNLLDFRWALNDHREILASLEPAAADFFGEKFSYYVRAISGEYDKIWTMLENSRWTFADLRQTNESLLSIETNETIRFLSVITFIFFPLTVITQIFGMQTHLPFVGQIYDFWIVMGINAAVVIFLYLLAKYRKWL